MLGSIWDETLDPVKCERRIGYDGRYCMTCSRPSASRAMRVFPDGSCQRIRGHAENTCETGPWAAEIEQDVRDGPPMFHASEADGIDSLAVDDTGESDGNVIAQ